jgi:hypothetical protein
MALVVVDPQSVATMRLMSEGMGSLWRAGLRLGKAQARG